MKISFKSLDQLGLPKYRSFANILSESGRKSKVVFKLAASFLLTTPMLVYLYECPNSSWVLGNGQTILNFRFFGVGSLNWSCQTIDATSFMIHSEPGFGRAQGTCNVTWKQAVNDKETFAELLDAFLSGPIPLKVSWGCYFFRASVRIENIYHSI